ncbi:hypothetical protein [Edaphobacter aggregans]|uniref:hypothetical protein n=1 Tax=Edaphobacter aggregans TaxID=570835 RepID=UPI0012F71353|nr:hypothetical protein [Edaphobacter aggregans]
MRYQLEALNSAQEAVVIMSEGLENSKSSSTPALALSAILTSSQRGRDDLLCAASIIGRYQPIDDDDKMIRGLLIASYNQEANALIDLQAHMKEQILRRTQSQNTLLKDAERISSISKTQDEAADTLIQMTTLSLMLSVDLRNPNAKNTEETLLSCKESEDLRKISAPIAAGKQSAYQGPATLFLKFLEGHKCNP